MTSKPKRPVLVTLLSFMFLWIGCVGSLFFPLFLFTGLSGAMWDQTTAGVGHLSTWIRFLVHFGKYPFLLAWFSAYVAYAFIGFGLRKLRNWSRKAVIGISILGILIGPVIGSFGFKSVPFFLVTIAGMVLPFVWIIWYFNRPRIRFAFGAIPPAEMQALGLDPPAGMTRIGKLFTTVAALATFALFIGALLVAVEGEMRHSQIYTLTLGEAEHSPCVAARIGQLTPGWMVSGNLQESAAKGSAHLSIPVSGPKGKGDLVVSAEKQDGVWSIEKLVMIQKGQETRLMPSPMTCE
jgi:hypothetical protein